MWRKFSIVLGMDFPSVIGDTIYLNSLHQLVSELSKVLRKVRNHGWQQKTPTSTMDCPPRTCFFVQVFTNIVFVQVWLHLYKLSSPIYLRTTSPSVKFLKEQPTLLRESSEISFGKVPKWLAIFTLSIGGVQLPIDQGGLSIGNILKRNQALLSKLEVLNRKNPPYGEE